jgi:hypothetical protein
MPYLDAVVKEAWRVDPIVPVVPRVAKQDFNFNGYDVPKVCRWVGGSPDAVPAHLARGLGIGGSAGWMDDGDFPPATNPISCPRGPVPLPGHRLNGLRHTCAELVT